MGDHAFHFKSFKFQEKHPHTITFIGTCTQISGDVKIKYTGADVQTVSPIPEEWLKELKEKLNEDYDYGPFDKNKINNIFMKNKSYIF